MNKSELKQFIKNFDFENPDFSNLPEGFPNLSKEGLSREKGHLFDAIKLAWFTTGGGQGVLFKTVLRRTLVGMAIAILIIFLGKNILINSEKAYAKSVNAATISATLKQLSTGEAIEGIVESTMSAIFKGKK